jgi:hypothetical protein
MRSSYPESLSEFSKQELNCNIIQRSASLFSLKSTVLKEQGTFPVNKITEQENGQRWIIQVYVDLYILIIDIK